MSVSGCFLDCAPVSVSLVTITAIEFDGYPAGAQLQEGSMGLIYLTFSPASCAL